MEATQLRNTFIARGVGNLVEPVEQWDGSILITVEENLGSWYPSRCSQICEEASSGGDGHCLFISYSSYFILLSPSPSKSTTSPRPLAHTSRWMIGACACRRGACTGLSGLTGRGRRRRC